MTSTRPSYIDPPSIEAYPYIKLLFLHINIGVPTDTEASHAEWFCVGTDDLYEKSLFETPADVTSNIMAPLAALSDETFAALCREIRPELFGTTILYKQDLSVLAAREFHRYANNKHEFSLDQLQCYMMFHALPNTDVQWAKIAELYNRSNEQQQEALVQFFTLNRNRNLVQLLTMPAPNLALPSSLDKTFNSKIEDGDTYLFSEEKNTWLREDIFMTQFSVHLKDIEGTHSILASAPTIDLALAKSIAYVTNSYDTALSIVEIIGAGKQLAQGRVIFTGHDKRSGIQNLTMPKIMWDLEHAGEYTGTWQKRVRQLDVEIASKDADKEADLRQQLVDKRDEIQRMIDDKRGIPAATFKNILYATEAAFGLQWSKVSSLEDDLGL